MALTKIRDYKDGTFGLLVERDGKYKQIARGKKSLINRKKAEVQAESINVEAAIQKKTFIEVYEEFYKSKIADASHEYSGLRLSSVTCYKSWFYKYFKPNFDNRVLLTEITPVKHAKPFFLKLRSLGVKWIQCKIVTCSILTCLKYAVEQQYIDPVKIGAFAVWSPKKDTSLKTKDPSEMEYKKTPMISLPEVVRLYEHIKPKDHPKISTGSNGYIKEYTDIREWQKFAVISTFIFTGMRISELRGLQWDAINFDDLEIEIKRTVVGNGGSLDQVKAKGSRRKIVIQSRLFLILKQWKKLLAKYNGGRTPIVFPSLRNVGYNIVALSDRTITDWIKLAFAAIGLAEIKIHPNVNGDKRAFIEITKSKFKRCITKTFRHFYCTALLNAQQKYPSILNSNFVKGQAGHQDDKTTRLIYGDHQNFGSDRQLEQQAIDNAIPIGIEPPGVHEERSV